MPTSRRSFVLMLATTALAAAGDAAGAAAAGLAAGAAGLGASVGLAGAVVGVFGVAGAQAATSAPDASIKTNERRDVGIVDPSRKGRAERLNHQVRRGPL